MYKIDKFPKIMNTNILIYIVQLCLHTTNVVLKNYYIVMYSKDLGGINVFHTLLVMGRSLKAPYE